jgi:NAD(P)-dependent dehydrogenase (short-subunit alcohol dehydrogenase family)
MELDGKRVLVIGASAGIGRATGVAAAAQGARVAFAARRTDLLDAAVAESGNGAIAVTCDVRDDASVTACVAGTADQFGGLDALVYSTAVDPLIRIADTDLDEWRRIFETNVFGASLACRAALPHLRASKGRAVFISASSVGRPLPGMGAYETSKAALEEMVRAWRSEHRDLCFSTVGVGNTLGTEVTASWDPALLGELSDVWRNGGYMLDNGPGAADVDEVAATVLTALTAPTCMQHFDVLPDPAVHDPL